MGGGEGNSAWRTDVAIAIGVGIFTAAWAAIFVTANESTNNQPGKDGFAAISYVYVVTVVVLGYAWLLRQRKLRKEERQRQERARRKAGSRKIFPGSGLDTLKKQVQTAPAVRNDDSTHNVKSRILNLWKYSRRAKGIVVQNATMGLRGTWERKYRRAVELFRAQVLTVYEAYIHLFRTYSASATGNAKEHPTTVLRKMIPLLTKLSDVVLLLDSIETSISFMTPTSDKGQAEQTAAKALSKMESAMKDWLVLTTDNPGLDVVAAKTRFDDDLEVNGQLMKNLEESLIPHLSFDERRVANVAEPTKRPKPRRRWLPAKVSRHKPFYLLIFLLYLAVIGPFIASINQGKMIGWTYLPLPPQYCFDCLEDGKGVPIQIVLIPIVFGMMHAAMLSLLLLPIPLCRGLMRDFAESGAHRAFFPVEDNVFLHKLFGGIMLGALLFAPLLWLIAMGSSCYGVATSDALAQKLACTAFAPTIADAVEGPLQTNLNVNPRILNPFLRFDSFRGGHFCDPRDNVLMLRIMVWPLFFGVTPWIINRDRTYFASWVPSIIKRYWFEWTTYSHYIIGYVAVIVALYARFEVFFPVILGWQLLFYNNYREMLLHTFDVDILVGGQATDENNALIHRSDIDHKPTAIELLIPRPERFHFSAGQYLMVKVNEIDPYYHSFSLASCPADEAIHLLIGIRGKCVKSETGEFTQADPTWTYKLHQLIRQRDALTTAECTPIVASVRGPYGSPFQCCYSDTFKATVLVGSGTGLTSALSVLKEVIHRRNPKYGKPKPMSDRVWFVWSCRNVKDLKWCWRTLNSALVEACATGAIELPDDWCAATSATLGWLGVSIYVSQANKDNLLHFLGYEDTFDPTIADALPMSSSESDSGRIVKSKSARLNSGRIKSARSDVSKTSDDGVAAVPRITSEAVSKAKRLSSGWAAVAAAVQPKKSLYAVVSTHIKKRRELYVSSQERNVLFPMNERGAEKMSDIVNNFLNSNQDREDEDELAKQIEIFRQGRQKVDVGAWLKEQVIASSLDSNGVHIKSLFEDLVDLEDPGRRRSQKRRVAVAFCGPSGLATSLSDICDDLDMQFEFLAHAE